LPEYGQQRVGDVRVLPDRHLAGGALLQVLGNRFDGGLPQLAQMEGEQLLLRRAAGWHGASSRLHGRGTARAVDLASVAPAALLTYEIEEGNVSAFAFGRRHHPVFSPGAMMDGQTSRTLLERARGRDEAAWSSLLRLYGPLVAHWCGRRGVVGPDADDIVQQVFQAVAAGLENFRRDRPGDTFRGWLRTITRARIVDHFRRLQSQPEAQGGTDAHRRLQEIAQQELPEDTPEELNGLYHRALEMVRGEFEERTWQAFWRSTVLGQATADIAADMGMTAVAIRKARSRVTSRLREELGDLIG
jgi:RNA polymerase sigma-70 factor (ECF subfamily)